MFEYKPTKTGLVFHESDDPVKMIMGPFGSGKSTIAAMDLLYNALAQPPAPDGTRYSRWGVIRASYANLKTATRKTILEVMPAGTGTITQGNAPFYGNFKFALPDRTRVQIEFELISSLTGEDAEKFKSSNWTGAWINEATEVSSEVLDMIMTRIGRYPTPHLGGCRWGGVIMDFNRPEKGHWLENLFGRPEFVMSSESGEPVGFRLLSVKQPPAAFKREHEDGTITYDANPEAENLENLKGGTDYYVQQIAIRQAAGKVDEIDALYCLLEATSRHGRPVWPMFRDKRHVALKKIDPVEGAPLLVGCDTSGIHPAAVLLQYMQGRWCVLDELYGDQEGLEVFMNSGLIPLIKGRYPQSQVTVSCDPANARDAYTGLAPTIHLQRAGFTITTPYTNRTETRISAVAFMLNVDVGGLLVSPHCEYLIHAMRGGDGPSGYHYAKHRLRGSVSVAYAETPEKNEASHIADALQYACLHVNREKNDNPRESFRIKQRLAQRNASRRGIISEGYGGAV
jgi:hypothetical protein